MLPSYQWSPLLSLKMGESASKPNSNRVKSDTVLSRSDVSKVLSSIKALEGASDLETAMATLAGVFYRSSERDGRASKAAVKELLLTQYRAFLKGQEVKPKCKEIFGDLDKKDEGMKVALEDFLLFIISLCVTSDLLADIRRATQEKIETQLKRKA